MNIDHRRISEDENFQTELDKIDLEMLSEVERTQVKGMLLEEKEVFSIGDSDIGDAPDLEMKLTTKDDNPVQKTYTSIPRPLFQEVKNHIADLLHRGWITKSRMVIADSAGQEERRRITCMLRL